MSDKENRPRQRTAPNGLHTIIPPHDDAAEQVVVGTLIARPEMIHEIRTQVNPNDIYDPDRRTIYTSLLYIEGSDYLDESTCVTMLRDRLKDIGELDRVGGFDVLEELYGVACLADGLGYFIEKIKNAASRRHLQYRSIATLRDLKNYEHDPDARRRVAIELSLTGPDLPVVTLPGGPIQISATGEALGKLLAHTDQYYLRGGAVVTVDQGDDGRTVLKPLKPAGLASAFETVARLMKTRNKPNGDVDTEPATCSEATAKLIIECDAFRAELFVIRVLTACPVLIERAGALMQVSGYDRESGVMAAGRPLPEVEIGQACDILHNLMADFRFTGDSDRARALAALITPALVFGGLLGGRAPVDLGEADQSQAGKGYRNKITAAIYGDTVKTIVQRKGGVGGLEESFGAALVRGASFISLDNVRGKIDSQAIESFMTEDHYLARTPFQPNVEIDPRRVIVMMTSNRAEITLDLANRSSCVSLQKQPPDYPFKSYPEGDLLDHVRANQPNYLAAVFAVVSAWHAAGKPRSDETRHDFRPWAKTLGWITEELLGTAPLMGGHREAQRRMSTPSLVWLRDVALAVVSAGKGGRWLRAHELLDVIHEKGITIPGLPDGGNLDEDQAFTKACQAIGRRMGGCLGGDPVVVNNIQIERQDQLDPQGREKRAYRFAHLNPPMDPVPPNGNRVSPMSPIPLKTENIQHIEQEVNISTVGNHWGHWGNSDSIGGTTAIGGLPPRTQVARAIRQARRSGDKDRATALRDGWRERVAVCVVDGGLRLEDAERVAVGEVWR